MAKLKATRDILYLNRLYKSGEYLPFYDASLVNAWIESGSAYWEGDPEDLPKAEKRPKKASGKKKAGGK